MVLPFAALPAPPESGVVTNPFSSRFIQPGAVTFVHPGEGALSSERLWTAFHQLPRGAAIVGPHGSGKSTLLRHLLQHAEQAGQRVSLSEWADGRPKTVKDLQVTQSQTAIGGQLATGGLLAIDGYEQLAWWRRLSIRRWASKQNVRLLVTSHAPTQLPTLATLSVTPRIMDQVIAQLVSEDLLYWQAQAARLHGRNQGNLREILFCLYDAWETRHRAAL